MSWENKNILVSVVMPNYNSEKYISEAIQSVLNQNFSNFEFIIIDDCSSDQSWNIIQKYAKKDNRILAKRNEKNLKVSKTLNEWINLSKWKYIAIMHSDDICDKNRLGEQYNFLEKNRNIWVVWSYVRYISWTWEIIYKLKTKPTNPEKIKEDIWKYSPIISPTFFLRKNIFSQIWYFNEELSRCEDFDFLVRAVINWIKLSNVDKILLNYRITDSQLSSNQREEMKTFFSIYKKYKSNFKIKFSVKIIIFIKYIIWIYFPKKVSTFLEHTYKKFKKYE